MIVTLKLTDFFSLLVAFQLMLFSLSYILLLWGGGVLTLHWVFGVSQMCELVFDWILEILSPYIFQRCCSCVPSPPCFCASSCNHCLDSSCILHTLTLSLLWSEFSFALLILQFMDSLYCSLIELNCYSAKIFCYSILQLPLQVLESWRGAAVKSARCFCRGAELCSQDPWQVTHYKSRGVWGHLRAPGVRVHNYMQTYADIFFVFVFHDLTYITLFKVSNNLGKFSSPLLV